eukprot:7385546-Prymnesium_polylepis.1
MRYTHVALEHIATQVAAEGRDMADEEPPEQQNEEQKKKNEEKEKRNAVCRIFLLGAGGMYAGFANEAARDSAILWFEEQFQWHEEYNGCVEKAANDMAATFATIDHNGVDSTTKHIAENLSGRQKQGGKKEPEKEPVAKKRKERTDGGDGGSKGGSSSDAVPPHPGPDAVSALVTFLR